MTQSMEIHARPEEVERVYRAFEAYPSYIAPISAVKENGERLECELRVAGFRFPYTARWEHAGPGEYRWQTVEGTISHRGTARIEPHGEGTRVTMEVSYDPPGGEVGARIANWFGLAESGLRHAMESFKAHVEAGAR